MPGYIPSKGHFYQFILSPNCKLYMLKEGGGIAWDLEHGKTEATGIFAGESGLSHAIQYISAPCGLNTHQSPMIGAKSNTKAHL